MSNCSRGCPHLFAEPCMCGFLIQSRVPRHEIWEWLDFSWRFRQTYASEGPNNLRQSSWHSQHQVGVRNCKHGCRKEWNAEGNTPFRTKLSERTIHGSLLARPSLDCCVRKFQILGQRKATGVNFLSGPTTQTKLTSKRTSLCRLEGGCSALKAASSFPAATAS